MSAVETMRTDLPRNFSVLRQSMRIVFFIWLGLLIVLSVSPLSFKLKLHTVGPYHNFWHYVVYVITAILLCQVSSRVLGRVLGFFTIFTVAFGQEWLENRMYHAGFEWKDVGTDLAGIVSGFALVTLVSVLFNDPDRRGLR